MMKPPRTTVLFDNLGPYHVARLAAASKVMPVHAIEFSGRSAEYAWDAPDARGIRRSTVNPGGPARLLPAGEFRRRLRQLLAESRPEVIAIPGWSGRGAFAAMEWALETHTPYLLMSDSTEWDEPRVAWKEAVKSRFVSGAAAALVAGRPHVDYMASLGMPHSRIFTGYDVVDNEAFRHGAATWRNQSRPHDSGTHPYFMASCRFVPKKNLPFLLEAYAAHLPQAAGIRATSPWDLVLMGDGELRQELILHAGKLGLEILSDAPWDCPQAAHARGRLLLPGFRQIGELFRFYAEASAFVHASVTEQWGLVVNEAMASGLPVVVSDRCGCAADLVMEGVNGWTFPPDDAAKLSGILRRLSTMPPDDLRSMGEEGGKLIKSWGPGRFTEALERAARTSITFGPRPRAATTRLALRGLALASR